MRASVCQAGRRRPSPILRALAVGLLVLTATAACGAGSGPDREARIVVSTDILGDVVAAMVGDRAEVEVVMPRGASPHEFSPSARQAVAMREADALIVNGWGFEAGLDDTVDAARRAGVNVFEAVSAVRPQGGAPHDPHFFTDPARMVQAVTAIAAHLRSTVPALRTAAFGAAARSYQRRLEGADAEVERILAVVPARRRVLVTDHEVFGYFAERYDFRVVGTVIPNLSTSSEPSARGLADLAEAIRAERVPAIFASTSAPARLARRLAATAGVSVRVVGLFSESLGPEGSAGATYLGMVVANAQRIAAALA